MSSSIEDIEIGDVLKLYLPNDQDNKKILKWRGEVISKKLASDSKYKFKIQMYDEANTVVKSKLDDIKWKIVSKRAREEEPKEPKKAQELVLSIPTKKLRVDKIGNIPISSLRFILAPMVGASELAFRLLCRKYGATLAYTPMMNSNRFATEEAYRIEEFQSTPEDRPLVAHFSANDPKMFLQAVKLVERNCDAIDLNLGCPQRVAFHGHFGSFLLDEQDRPLVLNLVRTIAENSIVPIFVKIRLLDTLEKTIELCQQLVSAGASLIAIHARHRVNLVDRKGPTARDGPALLDQVKAIREVISDKIPIISNGNIRVWEDIPNNLEFTKANGVMSAEGILDNPTIFNQGISVEPLQLAQEYLDIVTNNPTKLKSIVFHIRRMCKNELTSYQLMEDCLNAKTEEEVREIVRKMVHYKKTGSFRFDKDKEKKEKEALERKKFEENKRKLFEERMVRKAKREGKDLNFYLMKGAEIPTQEIIASLKAMGKEKAFEVWKEKYSQHCWSFHFDDHGCIRDRKCSFLHMDGNTSNNETMVCG